MVGHWRRRPPHGIRCATKPCPRNIGSMYTRPLCKRSAVEVSTGLPDNVIGPRFVPICSDLGLPESRRGCHNNAADTISQLWHSAQTRRCPCHRSFRTFRLVTIVFYKTFALSSSCSSSAFIDALPPMPKHSTDSTASTTYNAIKMVRFLPFIAALLTLGITAGAPLPSNPEGEYTTLPAHERKENCRIVANPSGYVSLAYSLKMMNCSHFRRKTQIDSALFFRPQ